MPSFNLQYRLACLYMGMTEKYDRSLTDVRSRYDPTEAFLYCNDIRNKIMKDYCILWKEIQSEIRRHNTFSSQNWIDEYERIWK